MLLLLTGATGYIGTSVSRALAAAGHDLVALVRPGSDTSRLPEGTRTVVAELAEPDAWPADLREVDGVVHLAPPVDPDADRAAIAALADLVRPRGGLLLSTSGVWVLGPTGEAAADETSPTRPIAAVAHRPAVEQQVLATADEGVRAVVLRPGVVHGRGGGIPALLVDLARRAGVGRFVAGDAEARWPMVHVDDLADLYVAAVERATAGAVLHGVAEASVPARELAVAAARAAGVRPEAQPWAEVEAAAELGAPFAEALALSQTVDAARTRSALGWQPTAREAVTEIAQGSYAAAALPA